MAVNPEVLESRRRMSEEAKRPFIPQQQKNRAMIAGEHWADWDSMHESLRQQNADEEFTDEKDSYSQHKARVTDNVMRQAEEARLAECVFNKPDIFFVPRGLTQTAKIAAAVAGKLWDVKYDELGMGHKLHIVRFLADMDSEAYIWPFWDTNLGRRIETKEFEGDVNAIVIPDQQVYPEPNKDYLEECNWVFVEFGMSIVEMMEQYNIKEDDLKYMEISTKKPHNQISDMWATLLGNAVQNYDTPAPMRETKKGKAKTGGYVNLKHYLEKPSSKYPDGLHMVYIVYTSKIGRKQKEIKVLHEGSLELNGELGFPLFEFWSGKQPGRYYGDPEMNSARAQQHRLNEIETQINEILKTVGVPMVGVDKRGFPPKLTSEEGSFTLRKDGVQFVLYDGVMTGGTTPIHPLGGLNPPASLYNEKAECERRIWEIMGVNKIGMQSVRQDAYQIQQASSRLEANVVHPQEMQVERLARFMIRLCKKYYETPREMKYTGNEFRIPELLYIRGKDIDFTTCKIERSSMMQSSALVRKQDALLALQTGLIAPTPENKRRLLLLISNKDLFPESPDSLNARNANAENFRFLMMVKGGYEGVKYDYPRDDVLKSIQSIMKAEGDETVGVQKELYASDDYVLPDNDDHEIHDEKHNNFILSEEVQNLPPDQKRQVIDIINLHRRLHQLALKAGLGRSEEMQQIKQALMTQMMQQQGQPGGGQGLEAAGGMGEKPHRRNPLSKTPLEFTPGDFSPQTDFAPGLGG